MSAVAEVRCPYCNGTASLPAARVAQIERERDAAAVARFKLAQAWTEISVLTSDVVDPTRRGISLATARARISGVHTRLGCLLTLHEKVGKLDA